MNKNLKPLAGLFLLVILIIIMSLFIPKAIIEEFVVRAGIFAPLAFIFASLITLVFAPISGTPVMSIGFYLFGNNSILYSYSALVIAMIINFWIARVWGIKIVIRLAGKENIKKINKFIKEHGLKTLFLIRFLLPGFEDLLSYAAGLTSVKFKPYFIISIAATIPWTIFWYLLSDKLGVSQFTTAILILSFLFFLSFVVWDKYFHKKED